MDVLILAIGCIGWVGFGVAWLAYADVRKCAAHWKADWAKQADRATEALERARSTRNALSFYAAHDNWMTTRKDGKISFAPALFDNGAKARAALGWDT